MEEELSLPDVPVEVLQERIWPRLDARSMRSIALSCRWGREALLDAELWFRRCCERSWGARACRLSWRHGGSWMRYYYEKMGRFEDDQGRNEVGMRVLALESRAAVLLDGRSGEVILRVVEGGIAACASPDGRYIAFDGTKVNADGQLVPSRSAMTVVDILAPRLPWSFDSGGSVVYSYWDPSSTRLTWISAGHGDGLGFSLADCSGKSPVVGAAIVSGAPFFWHISSEDPRLVAAHVRTNLWLLRFAENDSATIVSEPFLELATSSFQTPQVYAGAFVIFARPATPQTSALVCVSIAEVAERGQAAVMGQLERALSLPNALEDPHVLCLFESDMVRFQLAPNGRTLICGRHAEALLVDLWEIDMVSRARKRLPFTEEDALVSFFLSPDSKMVLFLGLNLAHHALQWTVFDRESGVARKASQVVHPSQRMVNNRIPFNSAYALSHSPWSRDSSCFVYADGTQGIKLQRVIRTTDRVVPFILPPLHHLSNLECGAAWFA